MHNHLNIGRQPIMDHGQAVIGYEFFYRNQFGECIIDDPRHATASVLVSILNHIGTEASIGNTWAFINTDGPLLLTDILRSLPKEKFVFELSSDTKITSRIHEAIRYFHSMGYRFALDNASFHPHYLESFSPIFPFMEFAKFDVTQTDIEQFKIHPDIYKGMKCIAQKVEFYEIAEEYQKLGFSYFQGFYFAKPHLVTQRRIDPKYMDVMTIFSLLQKDAPIEEIIVTLEQEHILSLQLLQFIRSSHPGFLEGVNSIRQLLEKLGKSELMQWLMLIIYSKSGIKSMDSQNVHSVFAQRRIDLMLELLHKAHPNPTLYMKNNARLIALFSLLEGLMNVPLESIMEEIRPDQVIEEAMISHSGVLGRIYAAVLKLESGDLPAAAFLLKPYEVTVEWLTAMHPSH